MHPIDLWRHWLDAGTLAAEANCVIAMRLARLAGGGAVATTEAQRMVTEKVSAIAASHMATGLAVASGKNLAHVYKSALRPFRSRVRANRRRLLRTS